MSQAVSSYILISRFYLTQIIQEAKGPVSNEFLEMGLDPAAYEALE